MNGAAICKIAAALAEAERNRDPIDPEAGAAARQTGSSPFTGMAGVCPQGRAR